MYAELRMSDSLLAPLDTIIANFPRETVYRTVQLRTLQILRRDERLRDAFEKWVRAVPRDPAPYREYARMLIELGRPASADSVVARGRLALGTLKDFEYENAQLRAAMGDWMASAQSWRRALVDAPHLANASAYSLAPAPPAMRDAIRSRGPQRATTRSWLAPSARRASSSRGDAPIKAWEALRALRADTAAATRWDEFGERAYTEERWSIARDALVAAVRVRRTPSSRATRAAGRARCEAPAHPTRCSALVPIAEWEGDPARMGRELLALHVGALVALGRPRDAEERSSRDSTAWSCRRSVCASHSWSPPYVAVRAGDLAKAREALAAAGP